MRASGRRRGARLPLHPVPSSSWSSTAWAGPRFGSRRPPRHGDAQPGAETPASSARRAGCERRVVPKQELTLSSAWIRTREVAWRPSRGCRSLRTCYGRFALPLGVRLAASTSRGPNRRIPVPRGGRAEVDLAPVRSSSVLARRIPSHADMARARPPRSARGCLGCRAWSMAALKPGPSSPLVDSDVSPSWWRARYRMSASRRVLDEGPSGGGPLRRARHLPLGKASLPARDGDLGRSCDRARVPLEQLAQPVWIKASPLRAGATGAQYLGAAFAGLTTGASRGWVVGLDGPVISWPPPGIVATGCPLVRGRSGGAPSADSRLARTAPPGREQRHLHASASREAVQA